MPVVTPRRTSRDPRALLIALAAALAALLLVNSPLKLGLFVTGFGLITACSGPGRFKAWLSYCRLLLPLIVLLFLLAGLVGEWEAALISALKMLSLGSAAFWFFQLTPPDELAYALVKWRVPYGTAFIIANSLRFVEVIKREWQYLREAQQTRGLVLKGWGWRHLPGLFGPLLVQTFRLGDELAEALEGRGFSAPIRTAPFSFRLNRLDYAFMLAALLAGLLFYLL